MNDLPDDLPPTPAGLWIDSDGAPRCSQPQRPLEQFQPERTERDLFLRSQSWKSQ